MPSPDLEVNSELLNRLRFSTRLQQHQLTSDIDDIQRLIHLDAVLSSDLSYRGQLGEGTEGPRGRGQGGSSLEGAGKGRLWRKGSRKEVDGGAQLVNALLSHLSCL